MNNIINSIEFVFPFFKNPHDLSKEDFIKLTTAYYGTYKNFCKYYIEEFNFTKPDNSEDNSIANILVQLNIYNSKSEVYNASKSGALKINNKSINPNGLLTDIVSFKMEEYEFEFWIIKKGKIDFEIIWFRPN